MQDLGEMGFTRLINQTDFPRNSLSVITHYMLQVVGINGMVVVSPCFKYHVGKMLSIWGGA